MTLDREWRRSTSDLISEGLLEIGDGYRAKNVELADSGIPFARVQNLNTGFDFSGADLFPLSSIDRVGSKVSRPGDCVLTSKGSVGRVAFVSEGTPRFVYSPQLSYWRSLDSEVIHPLYLRYWLLGPEFITQRDAVKGSTDMADYVNLRDQRRMQITVPPIEVQRKIAAILAAYDDLIENNSRRIQLLEEMTQRIYREWFVEFRYPGHEAAPLVDSELGPIPEGWLVGCIGDHADVFRGRSYRGVDVVEDGGVPFVNLKCLERDGGFRTEGVKRYAGAFKAAHTVRVGDIVMAVTDMTQERRIVARAARIPRLNDEVGVFSMDLVKIVPSDVSAEYLLGLLSYSDFANRVKAYANGANVLHLHPDRISDFRMAFAPPEIEERYAAVISPAQDLADALLLTSVSLRATRDLLLPRLISGVVDVTDLDIALSEVAV